MLAELSQKELAERQGVDPSTLSKLELGKWMPQGSYLAPIRHFLDSF